MTGDFFNKCKFPAHFSPLWTQFSEFFFNFRFSRRKSQNQQKASAKDHISSNTVSLKKPNSIYKPQLTWHWKILLPQDSQKPFSLYKFSSKHLVSVIKNIGTAPFLEVQEPTSQSTLKANLCMFLYIYLRKLYLVLCFICYITSLRPLAVWASQNVLQFSILVEIFGNSTIFQHFNTSIYSIEMRKFSRKFWLEGQDCV